MKLFFVHDHPFFVLDNKVYSGGGLPQQTWRNYLNYFDHLTVTGRRSFSTNDKEILSSIDGGPVKFKLMEQYSSIPNFVLNFKTIYKSLNENVLRSDITIVRVPSILGFYTALICLIKKKPFIVEQVGNTKEAYATDGSFKGKFLASLLDRLNKYINLRAPFVIFVTETQLQKSYPTSGIHTSISNVIIEEVRNNIDKTKRFNEKKLKIGIIGGFDVRYKGQDVLLKAVSQLNKNIRNNIEIFFVGKGNSEWLTSLIEDLELQNTVKFIGSKKSGEEIFSFLDTLSIYIQPSLTEGMPRSLLEAMSRGCPVLGSVIGGIPDVVNPHLLHKAGDNETLTKQITELYNNRKLLEDESDRSLEKIRPFLKVRLDKKRNEFYKKVKSKI